MIDPDQLTDSIVLALRDIPVLVIALGNAAGNIVAYHHDYPNEQDRLQVVAAMPAPRLMAAWARSQFPNRAGLVEHFYALYLKPLGKPGPAFQALRDGVVTSSGAKFKTHMIVDECHPPDILSCDVRSVFIGPQSVVDYHEITLRMTERGADN